MSSIDKTIRRKWVKQVTEQKILQEIEKSNRINMLEKYLAMRKREGVTCNAPKYDKAENNKF